VCQHGPDVFLYRHYSGKQAGWLALASHEVIDASENYRRTTIALSMFDIGDGVPVHGMDSIVEFLFAVLGQQVRGIYDAQKLLSRLRVDPEVNAKKPADTNLATGLFHCFANYGVFRGLAGFDMPSGLRDDNDTGRAFFNDQVFFVPFDDGTNSEICR
jgi:hypothetical protein